jgi:putative membrane protein
MYRLKLTALVAVVSLASVSMVAAQTSPPAASPKSTDQAAPLPGANSFTEAQAKDRMEKAGFTQVAKLAKDKQGVWRASAMQGGKQVNVALDFRGNVVVTQ